LAENANQYRAVFSNQCGTATSTAAILTVHASPDATITTDPNVCPNGTGYIASVPDAGAGATYTWTVSGGTINAGPGTGSITYTAGGSGTLRISVTVKNGFNCTTSSSVSLTVMSAEAQLNIWETLPTPVWLSSGSLGANDHRYAEGNGAPVR